MTAYDMIQKLAQYPANTKVVLSSNWCAPVLSDKYLILETDPCLCIGSTQDLDVESHQAAAVGS